MPIACLVLASVLIIYNSKRQNRRGKYEEKVRTLQPPTAIPETQAFMTFRSGHSVRHIRADRIKSFSYNHKYQTLIINDGAESPAMIRDPRYRYYARLCERFGCLPMAATLKGSKKDDLRF